MKSFRYYKLLAFALSLPAALWAADFGDIPANLALPSGTSVRRNAGNTGFESFTPGSGNVSNSGTPLLDQVAVWTDATHIKGVTTIKGGTTGQVLQKSSNTDYDYTWATVVNPTPTATATATPTATATASATATATPTATPTATVFIEIQKVTFVADGAGIVLQTGTKNPFKTDIDFGGTLRGWTAMCKPSGSVTIDILRAANGAGLPVTSIVGGGTAPAISSNVEASGTNFSGWTSTTLNAKDNLAISLSGITAATYVEITLYYQ